MLPLLLYILTQPRIIYIPGPAAIEITAYVTAYSATETARHNPKGLNAMSRKPQWLDVACPRWLEFGQRVEILGYEFTCRDRYALWLDTERDLPTFDIFSTDYQSAIDWGKQKMKVKIIKQ